MTPLLLSVLTLALSAASPAVVRVGDASVDASELGARAAALRASPRRLTPEQILDAIVGDLVLAQDARRTGLSASPAVRLAVETEKARALAAHLVETTLAAGVTVSEQEVLRLYHLGNDTVRLSLVVLATEDEASRARKRLEQGGEWALEASRSLDPTSASKRGDTGMVSRMQIDEALASAVFAAPVGALVGPVKLANGFAVARVVERSIANEKELPTYRPQIVAYARRTGAAKAREHMLEMRRKAAAVSVDDAYVGSLTLPLNEQALDLDRKVATLGKRTIVLRDVIPVIRSAPATGHGAKMVITRAVHAFVDDLLLAEEASRSGIDRTPAGAAALARAEVRALARAKGDEVLARQPKGATPQQRGAALTKRIAELRKELGAWVDTQKALAAVSGRN